MKRFLVVLLLICCFIFAGCSNEGIVGYALNSDGSIIEFYSLPYAEEELLNAGITEIENQKIKEVAKEKLDNTFTTYLNKYKAKIDSIEQYSNEKKEELKNGVSFDSSLNINSSLSLSTDSGTKTKIQYIQYEIYFKNSTCYTIFKNSNTILNEPKTVVVEKKLFTTTTKTTFDNMALETISLGKNVSSAMEGVVIDVLAGESPTDESIQMAKDRWSAIKVQIGYNSASKTFTYCHIVPTARLHSNANAIIQKDGYYYHYWKIDADNFEREEQDQVHFEYWTTTANKPIWYGIAILGGGIVGLVTYFVAKRKEKKALDDFNKNNNLEI